MASSRPSWRLIVDEAPCSGAWNMALDRALQCAHAEGESEPVLRLYAWARPTLTLGRFQSVDSVDLAACRMLGVDVTRRFTGGRGVLHDDEVTYSIVAGVRDGIPRGTSASYRVLSEALVRAYRELGVDAELTARSRGDRGSAACYLHATNADLSLGARKLSGSAQVWHRDSVLQHGSFVISRDVDREVALFGLDEQARVAMAESTATLAGILGRRPPVEDVQRAVAAGLRAVLGVDLAVSGLSEGEIERARGFLPEVLVEGPVGPGPRNATAVSRDTAARGSG